MILLNFLVPTDFINSLPNPLPSLMTIQDLKLICFYFCRSSLSLLEKSPFIGTCSFATLLWRLNCEVSQPSRHLALWYSLQMLPEFLHMLLIHLTHSSHPSVDTQLARNHILPNSTWIDLYLSMVTLYSSRQDYIQVHGRERFGLVHLFLSHPSFIGGSFLPNNWSIDNSAHSSETNESLRSGIPTSADIWFWLSSCQCPVFANPSDNICINCFAPKI